MTTHSPAIPLHIVQFIDDHAPGYVACTLRDAHGIEHKFILTTRAAGRPELAADSNYPQPGALACEIEFEWEDDAGTALARVSTRRPWAAASIDGMSSFVVPAAQLLRAPAV
ncbi:hypothetical protein [Duganella sp. HH105]|uniref:hypothetical protein n=1 Tax=Duganella sp. HH105 TaxID=1781067 RepID=UPI000877C74E|nr:hypothetical protein [Duganella sp. HH105]OEZ54880.1 hypothetical protein DUGA6_56510 [Duganella sp. HH105]